MTYRFESAERKQTVRSEAGRVKPVGAGSGAGTVAGANLPLRRCACGGGCPRCRSAAGEPASLRIGAADAPQEKEADAMADRVMRATSGKVSAKITRTAPELARQPADAGATQQTDAGTEDKTEKVAEKVADGTPTQNAPAPACQPRGLARDAFLKEPGATTKEFGLTVLDTSQVTYPAVVTQAKGRGRVELLPTSAALPSIPSIYTAAGTFTEGDGHFLGQNGAYDCPSRKYPLRWIITAGGANQIRAGEQEHCADFQLAFDRSLKPFSEAVNALAGKVYGSEAAANKAVAKKAKAKPADWPGIFRCLARKSLIRDSSHWHDPKPFTKEPTQAEGCNFATARIYAASLPEVGRHPSADIVKDCGEPAAPAAPTTAVPTTPAGAAQSAGTQTSTQVALPLAEGVLQRAAVPSAASGEGGAPASVPAVLAQSGQALDPAARQFMEQRFAADFSAVQVHADAQAAASAQEVGALAYTVGSHLVFGAGQYRPQTQSGRHLLAHELTHVLQQDEAGLRLQRQVGGSKLRAARFQGDPILEQVMDNLIILRNGSRGPQINIAVQKIQQALIDAGFPLPEYGPDGLFGSETEAAVKNFQASKDLTPDQQDGKVGPITMGLLDDHFASDAPPDKPPKTVPPEVTAIDFSLAEDSEQPRYSNPDFYLKLKGNLVNLEGPTYSFLAKVLTVGGAPDEAAQWDLGHVQDLTGYTQVGMYADGHSLAFEADFPIRDSAKGEQRFPFYYPKTVLPASNKGPVSPGIMDSPNVEFPVRHKGSRLVRIDMTFKAIEWVTARQRRSEEMRFVHHAAWGFSRSLVLGADWKPGKALPEPTGPNDDISHASGKGDASPSMTEAVYNDSAKAVEIPAS